MPGTPTTRLSIPTLSASADSVSGYPAVNLAQMDIVDTAVIITEGTLASRPSSSLVYGQSYYATDTGLWYFYNGSAWQTVMLAGAWTNLTASVNTTIGTAQARVVGDSAELRGTAHLNSGITSGTINIPSAAAPSATRAGIAVLVGSSTADLGLQASITGTTLTLQPAINSPTTASVNLDFSYAL